MMKENSMQEQTLDWCQLEFNKKLGSKKAAPIRFKFSCIIFGAMRRCVADCWQNDLAYYCDTNRFPLFYKMCHVAALD